MTLAQQQHLWRVLSEAESRTLIQQAGGGITARFLFSKDVANESGPGKCYPALFSVSVWYYSLFLQSSFYYHFTFTKSAVHTEGIIVDAVWYNNHSNDVDDNGSWYPVVAFRPTPDYTLIFNSNIGSDFYEDSEGDRVNVYYPPGIQNKPK